ncbi:MAG TPA: glycerate kinase [Desulfuromonadales bacterium]|nr:glycerate kinase [Desulfuromonadales bacterium]
MERTQIISEQIFRAALREAAPREAVHREMRRVQTLYRDGGFRRLVTVGFGKAAPVMAGALAESLGDLVDTGLVITKYGHALTSVPGRIKVFEAGHPVPDRNGLRATEELIRLVRAADERTLIVTLISGGGSALLVSPQDGISLVDKQRTTSLLLNAGADISELNTVRKHLSRAKGGRLAEAAFPATVVSLILSDVVGDRLDVIASGPTAADPTTFGEALGILERHRLSEAVPPPVLELLRRGGRGDIPETPKAGSPFLDRVENIIVGSNRQALEAAARSARELGFTVEILSAELTGEAREVGRQLARQTRAAASSKAGNAGHCLLAGGETTVTVRGQGKGGRNMELALAFAIEIEGQPGITLLSAGTDGTDGPTDAAGAIVDGETVARAREQGLDPRESLDNNDSYTFFERCGGLLVTGATGTNVMDLQIVLID